MEHDSVGFSGSNFAGVFECAPQEKLAELDLREWPSKAPSLDVSKSVEMPSRLARPQLVVGLWPEVFMQKPRGSISGLVDSGGVDLFLGFCPLPRSVRKAFRHEESRTVFPRYFYSIGGKWAKALPEAIRRYWYEEVLRKKQPNKWVQHERWTPGIEGSWASPFLVVAFAAKCPSFKQLLISNPALANEILSRARGPIHPSDEDQIRWLEKISRLPRRDLLDRCGFPASRLAEKILRKISPEARTSVTVDIIRSFLIQKRHLRELSQAKRIGGGIYNFTGEIDLEEWFSTGARIRAMEESDKSGFLQDLVCRLRDAGVKPPPGGYHSYSSLPYYSPKFLEFEKSKKERWVEENFSYPAAPFKNNPYFEPIRDRRELMAEGEEQQNCLRNPYSAFEYEEEILEKGYYPLKVLYPLRATMLIERTVENRSKWRVVEISLKNNLFVSMDLGREIMKVVTGNLSPWVLRHWENYNPRAHPLNQGGNQ